MQKISSLSSHPLYDVAATRLIEQKMAGELAQHTLMQRAGLSVARLALALAPHARCIWIACGPGNNGGDGFEAALHLHRWGKSVVVTWTGLPPGKAELPPDARASHQRALAAGVPMAGKPPSDFDLCIDALLGVGAVFDPTRPGGGLMQEWLESMQGSPALRLSVDVPTGLNADTGTSSFQVATKYIADGAYIKRANRLFTLSLLTLKPGLFTASGRDCAGEVWFDDLALGPASSAGLALPTKPCAWLLGADRSGQALRTQAAHASHKGSFGDVAVLGGESTAVTHMTGAALLAASAALHAGAGRVFVALLGNASGLSVDPEQPELMFRSPEALDMVTQVVVCGCGGGDSVASALEKVLSTAKRLVLDADALNAIAMDRQLQTQLKARHTRDYSTVLRHHHCRAWPACLGQLHRQCVAGNSGHWRCTRRINRRLSGTGTEQSGCGQERRVRAWPQGRCLGYQHAGKGADCIEAVPPAARLSPIIFRYVKLAWAHASDGVSAQTVALISRLVELILLTRSAPRDGLLA